MRLTAEHLQAIADAAMGVRFGRVTIEISETAQTVDIITESRLRIQKDCDTTPHAGKVIRIGLKRDGCANV